jgi:hypothetical protein
MTTRIAEYIRQLVIESEVQRLSTREALAYIQGKLGRPLAEETYFYHKRGIKKSGTGRLAAMMKSRDAFLQQYFERIDECKKYQQELWRLMRLSDNDFLKKSCITELREITVILTQLYDLMPQMATVALGFNETRQVASTTMNLYTGKQNESIPVSKPHEESTEGVFK